MSRRKKDSRWSDVDGGAAFIVPITLLRPENFRRLSPNAIKMLMDLARQYTGFNNGYLCGAWTLAQKWGWKSATTVRDALLELEHFRVIVRSQQGGRNRPNLYAFTFRRIDSKEDLPPLDIPRSFQPDNKWKEPQPLPFEPACRKRKELARQGV